MSGHLEEGIALYNAGRYREAARCFQDCKGDSARLFLKKAKEMLSGRAPRGAPRRGEKLAPLRQALARRDYAAVFKEAEKLWRDDPSAAYRELRDHWLKGEFPGLKDGSGPWRPFFLAAVAWARGDDAQALKLLERAAKGRHGWMRYYRAEILLRRLSRYAEAATELRGLARRYPWLWEARCLGAEAMLALGKERQALAQVSRLAVPEPSRPAFFAWRGALKLWTGRYKEALEDLDKAVDLGNPDAPCWRGGALTCLGRLDAAIKDLSEVLARDPKDPEALVWRAEARRKAGDTAGAERDLETALSLTGAMMNPWAYANRGLLRLEQGDIEGAALDVSHLGPPWPAGDGTTEHRPVHLPARKLRALLQELLRLGRGCRRADPHLNLAWMRASKVLLPREPMAHAGLYYWMKAHGISVVPENELRRVLGIRIA